MAVLVMTATVGLARRDWPVESEPGLYDRPGRGFIVEVRSEIVFIDDIQFATTDETQYFDLDGIVAGRSMLVTGKLVKYDHTDGTLQKVWLLEMDKSVLPVENAAGMVKKLTGGSETGKPSGDGTIYKESGVWKN